MSPTMRLPGTGHPYGGATAVFVLDGAGTVLVCTAAAEELTGRPAVEIRGARMADLVADSRAWSDLAAGAPGDPRVPREGHAALRHRDGPPAEVWLEVLPLPSGNEARLLVSATPSAVAQRREEDQALVRALFAQKRILLIVYDTELRTTRVNFDPEEFGVPSRAESGEGLRRSRLDEFIVPEDAAAIMAELRRVADTGEPLVDWEHSARLRKAPERERQVSLSAFRLQDAHGRALGVAMAAVDVTEQRTAQRRMELLHRTSARLGHPLDATRNAEELTRVLVPGLADLVAVDLRESVLTGEEPEPPSIGALLRRVAVAAADGRWPAELFRPDDTVPPLEVEGSRLCGKEPLLFPDLDTLRPWGAQDADRARLLLPPGGTSMMTVPLLARGLLLGVVVLWRLEGRTPFHRGEVSLAEEVVSRVALSMDNARRFTRETRTVETLQRSLLPPTRADLSAAETAGLYVAADTASGIGGSWYDVIPLSSTRVALVVGDVAGHGLGATATMGRLRTAVQTLADLDLAPEELLTRLDDLVVRLADTEPSPGPGEGGVAGATCLYCVYDPVSGRCTMASAGHPPPVLAGAGGRVGFVDLTPGPALGLGGTPFEPVDLYLQPGSLLTLYTDELTARGEGDAERKAETLRLGVESALRSADSPAGVGRAVLEHALPDPPADDVALLVARVRALPEEATAAWQFMADPSAVARARELAVGQLAAWGLEELAFTTELIVSELVTNAVRHAGAPVGLRLIKDRSLVCEVSDPSQTQPHLRRARLTDESGRGLFLVAQLTHRWGSRYTPSGKTIWTEQPLSPQGSPEEAGVDLSRVLGVTEGLDAV